MRRRTSPRLSACPKRKTISFVWPGASMTSVITAAQGSSGVPTWPESPTRPSAAGDDAEPSRPRNSVRSAVADWGEGTEARKASFSANGPAQALREDSAALRIALTDDLQRGILANGSEDPLGIVGRGQFSLLVAVVAHGQAHHLDRIVGRHDYEHFLMQIMTFMGIASVTLPVAHCDRCAAPGATAWVSTFPRNLVAQVDHFARRVRSRII